MRYYIDTEFNELVTTKAIDLISIGIVSEDDREYFAVNRDCDFDQVNPWVKANVLPLLPCPDTICLNADLSIPLLDRFKNVKWKPHAAIAKEILDFIGDDPKPEFWGYYCSSDWVVFYQLFGTLMSLPKNFSKRCNDIQQECDRQKGPVLPKHLAKVHNALEDAKWIKKAHEFLIEHDKIKTLFLSE